MNASMIRASWVVVCRSGLLIPVAATCLLVASTIHLFDDGHAARVLRGVSVLLACAWVSTMDDPMGEIAAGSSYPRSTRSLVRAAVGLAVIVPLWTGVAVLGHWRAGGLPLLSLVLEAVGLCLAGIAAAACLRAWGDRHQPSYLAVPGLVATAVGIDSLPRGWAMVPSQTWGPPWEAAQLRWAALSLLCVGLLVAALRDPMPDRPDRRERGTGRRSRRLGCQGPAPRTKAGLRRCGSHDGADEDLRRNSAGEP